MEVGRVLPVCAFLDAQPQQQRNMCVKLCVIEACSFAVCLGGFHVTRTLNSIGVYRKDLPPPPGSGLTRTVDTLRRSGCVTAEAT